MSEYSKLQDGFAILDRMSIDEIERRLAWLESSVSIYRTLLAVKKCHAAAPQKLEVEWLSAVDMDRQEKAQPSPTRPGPPRNPRGSVQAKVDEYLQGRTGGASAIAISHATGLTSVCIESLFYRSQDRYVKVGKGIYALRNGHAIEGNA